MREYVTTEDIEWCVNEYLSRGDFQYWLNKQKAEAWDEGFQDGRRQDSEGDDGPKFVNPYRDTSKQAQP